MMSSFRNLIRKLRVPVIAAPMAGGFNNPTFAAAVIRAGGIASFGFAYSSPDNIYQQIRQTRGIVEGPINANFFVFRELQPPTNDEVVAAISAIALLGKDITVTPKVPVSPFYPDLMAQLEPIWDCKPELLTFHFGLPPAIVLSKAKSLGILVGVTATTVLEAVAIRDYGADFVIAQGIEAGGHRGNFLDSCELLSPCDRKAHAKVIFVASADSEIVSSHTMAHNIRELVVGIDKEFKKSGSIPIVASGGIMSGADVRSILCDSESQAWCSLANRASNLNENTKDFRVADAVQMGTAFLTTKECSASVEHKAKLLAPSKWFKDESLFTNAFSGRYARGLSNEFIQNMEGRPILEFPLQNTITTALRQWAQRNNDPDLQSLWCGTGYRRCRDTSVAELMESIREELSTVHGRQE